MQSYLLLALLAITACKKSDKKVEPNNHNSDSRIELIDHKIYKISDITLSEAMVVDHYISGTSGDKIQVKTIEFETNHKADYFKYELCNLEEPNSECITGFIAEPYEVLCPVLDLGLYRGRIQGCLDIHHTAIGKEECTDFVNIQPFNSNDSGQSDFNEDYMKYCSLRDSSRLQAKQSWYSLTQSFKSLEAQEENAKTNSNKLHLTTTANTNAIKENLYKLGPETFSLMYSRHSLDVAYNINQNIIDLNENNSAQLNTSSVPDHLENPVSIDIDDVRESVKTGLSSGSGKAIKFLSESGIIQSVDQLIISWAINQEVDLKSQLENIGARYLDIRMAPIKKQNIDHIGFRHGEVYFGDQTYNLSYAFEIIEDFIKSKPTFLIVDLSSGGSQIPQGKEHIIEAWIERLKDYLYYRPTSTSFFLNPTLNQSSRKVFLILKDSDIENLSQASRSYTISKRWLSRSWKDNRDTIGAINNDIDKFMAREKIGRLSLLDYFPSPNQDTIANQYLDNIGKLIGKRLILGKKLSIGLKEWHSANKSHSRLKDYFKNSTPNSVLNLDFINLLTTDNSFNFEPKKPSFNLIDTPILGSHDTMTYLLEPHRSNKTAMTTTRKVAIAVSSILLLPSIVSEIKSRTRLRPEIPNIFSSYSVESSNTPPSRPSLRPRTEVNVPTLPRVGQRVRLAKALKYVKKGSIVVSAVIGALGLWVFSAPSLHLQEEPNNSDTDLDNIISPFWQKNLPELIKIAELLESQDALKQKIMSQIRP